MNFTLTHTHVLHVIELKKKFNTRFSRKLSVRQSPVTGAIAKFLFTLSSVTSIIIL